MSAVTTARPKSGAAQGVGYNLLAISLALVLIGLALAYAIDAAGRDGRVPAHRTDGGITLARTLGGVELHIPQTWFRNPEQPAEGFAREIELNLVVPLGPAGALRDVDVTLMPRSGVRASAALLDGVYLHMFTEAERDGPQGLIGKPLRPLEGYATETVWYDPISADPFVAKCGDPVAEGRSRCLRAVHLAPGIAAVYAFDADLLANWRQFDDEVHRYLRRIGVAGP